jgi:Tol biopolymer transport system component
MRIVLSSSIILCLCFTATSFLVPDPVKGIPELFAPDVVSTQDDELNGTFSQDGTQFYFTKKSPTTQRSSTVLICVSSLEGGKWSTPSIAPFSGPYKDLNPFITNDGTRFYFVSTRPVGPTPKFDADIWFMEKTGAMWSLPKNSGNAINSELYEQSVCVADNGTLYLSSARDRRSLDLYKSELVNGVYQTPENLGEEINNPDVNEQDVFISPDESYLIFSCTGRADAMVSKSGAQYPRSDLYISYRRDGKWTNAVNLGPRVNSEADESNPSVSRDGKTLYFTSERNFASRLKDNGITYPELTTDLRRPGNGLGDIYSIPFKDVTP